jgi:predicted membrane-bound spermidine synthase
MTDIPEFVINQVLYDQDTLIEHYSVVDTNYNNRPARILYTDDRLAAQSGLPFDDNDELLFDYNQRFIELVRQAEPKHMLIIGGGAFTLPMAINKNFPRTYVDVYEIDDALIDIATKYFGLRLNKNLNVKIGDGRKLLKQESNSYDLVIIDVFNSVDIPTNFLEISFLIDVKNKLKPGGIVAMNVISSYYGDKSKTLDKLKRNFKKTFIKTQIKPATDNLSFWLSQNFILIGYK